MRPNTANTYAFSEYIALQAGSSGRIAFTTLAVSLTTLSRASWMTGRSSPHSSAPSLVRARFDRFGRRRDMMAEETLSQRPVTPYYLNVSTGSGAR